MNTLEITAQSLNEPNVTTPEGHTCVHAIDLETASVGHQQSGGQ